MSDETMTTPTSGQDNAGDPKPSLAAMNKLNEGSKFLFGAAVLVALPISILVWIWSGLWQPAASCIVIALVAYGYSECVEHAMKRDTSASRGSPVPQTKEEIVP